jgi:molecular chaperone HtpG
VYWVSAGDGQYDIGKVERAERGTEIVLHLKKGESEFLDEWRLRNLISKYSDHISRPVMMTVRDYAAESELRGDDADKKVPNQYKLEQINAATALWTRDKSELDDTDYQAFYKHIAHDFADPLTWSHNRVEGKLNYTSLLYVPAKAPFDLWNREAQRGLKLYVQRVFIMDDAEQFLPLYLRFMKGVIDSNDLSLNVSREILQNNKTVQSLKTALTKRTLSLLEKMANKKPEQYQSFWDQFGQVLKEGPAEDREHQDKIANLLRFATTDTADKTQSVSLKTVQERMKEGQKAFYYLAAESHEAALASPHLEIFRKQGIEVLLLSDRVDEWLMSHLSEFNGLPFKDIAKGELDLEDILGSTESESESGDEPLATVIEHFKTRLSDDVSSVRLSRRLTDSPACLVVNDGDMGAQMQRLLAAAGQTVPTSKPVLELNPDHPLVQQLNVETLSDEQTDLLQVIYEQARLAGGDGLKDPSGYVAKLNRLLLRVNQA